MRFVIPALLLVSACTSHLDARLTSLKEQTRLLEEQASQSVTWIDRDTDVDAAIWLSSTTFDAISRRINSIPDADRKIVFQQNDQGGHISRRRINCSLGRSRETYIEPRGNEPLNLSIDIGRIESEWSSGSQYELSLRSEILATTKLYWAIVVNRDTLCAGVGDKARLELEGGDRLVFRIQSEDGRLSARIVSPEEFVFQGDLNIAQMSFDQEIILDLREEGLLDELFSLDQTGVIEGSEDILIDGSLVGTLNYSTQVAEIVVINNGWDIRFDTEIVFEPATLRN
ncbi:MAG: hypothetical protein AAF642_00715 [Pseudomonadota bacterium]